MSKRIGSGFTLVELLVAITIIIMLLALLTPALDKAGYDGAASVSERSLTEDPAR